MSVFQQSATRPEVEVLLTCARTRMESDTAERLTSVLQEKIDWDFLVEEALYHGTAPLLYRNLSLSCSGRIPEVTLKQLRSAVGFIACWNLAATGELLELLKLFGEIGIRALPLKGPALGAAVYGDLSLRPFGDLDILMARKDILKAKDVLLQRGYQPVLQLSSTEERIYLQTHHDYKFNRSRDATTVELQWGVTQWSFAFPLDLDEIWQRRGIISLAGTIVPTIMPEDLLLALCVHGAKHRWERLKWICDIAELVAAHRDTIIWDRVAVRARALGGERMLLLGLFLAHDLLDANLPSQVLKTIQHDSQINFLAGGLRGSLFRERSQADELRDEQPFFYWRVRERLGDKLAVAWRYFPDYFHRMITPNYRDRAFLELPAYLSLGYYLVRPVRLMKYYWSKSRRRAGEVGK